MLVFNGPYEEFDCFLSKEQIMQFFMPRTNHSLPNGEYWCFLLQNGKAILARSIAGIKHVLSAHNYCQGNLAPSLFDLLKVKTVSLSEEQLFRIAYGSATSACNGAAFALLYRADEYIEMFGKLPSGVLDCNISNEHLVAEKALFEKAFKSCFTPPSARVDEVENVYPFYDASKDMLILREYEYSRIVNFKDSGFSIPENSFVFEIEDRFPKTEEEELKLFLENINVPILQSCEKEYEEQEIISKIERIKTLKEFFNED